MAILAPGARQGNHTQDVVQVGLTRAGHPHGLNVSMATFRCIRFCLPCLLMTNDHDHWPMSNGDLFQVQGPSGPFGTIRNHAVNPYRNKARQNEKEAKQQVQKKQVQKKKAPQQNQAKKKKKRRLPKKLQRP